MNVTRNTTTTWGIPTRYDWVFETADETVYASKVLTHSWSIYTFSLFTPEELKSFTAEALMNTIFEHTTEITNLACDFHGFADSAHALEEETTEEIISALLDFKLNANGQPVNFECYAGYGEYEDVMGVRWLFDSLPDGTEFAYVNEKNAADEFYPVLVKKYLPDSDTLSGVVVGEPT